MQVTENFIITDNGMHFDRRYYTVHNGQPVKRKYRRPQPSNDGIPTYRKLFAHFMLNPNDSPQEVQKKFGLKNDTTAYAQRKRARIALKKEGKWEGKITTYKKHNRRKTPKHPTVEERGIPEEVLTEDMRIEKGIRGPRAKKEEIEPADDIMTEATPVTVKSWRRAFATMINGAVIDLEHGQDPSIVASRLRTLADALDR